MAKNETLRRRGKQAKRTGDAFENEVARDYSEACGFTVKRELREVRDGTLGDLQEHPRVPFIHQIRKRKNASVWAAIEDVRDLARGQNRMPVAVVENRTPGNAKNRKGVLLYLDDLKELLETFEALPPYGDRSMVPRTQWTKRTGAKYPRVWDGLAELEVLAAPGVRICVGHVVTGEDVALIDYKGWFSILKALYSSKLW